MPIDLVGKPIAITGASSGIGLATAYACARAGMPVALAARRADRLTDAARRIRDEGGKAIAVPCDVSRPDDCRRLIDEAVSAFGSLYAVFANAGYGLEIPIHEATDADLRGIFETNFWGTLNTIRPALELMRPARAGHILICTSCLAKLAIPTLGPYTATKAAQDHIGRAMRTELRAAGIHVSTVHPIGTRTELFDAMPKQINRAGCSTNTPQRFVQTPERVANAIVKCLRRPRGEVWTSLPTRLAFSVALACPGFADALLWRKFGPRVAP